MDCNCIFHKTFCGLLESTVTCFRCGSISTAFDPFIDISLDLSQRKDDKDYGVHSLLDCLYRFTKPEKLDNKVYNCSACNNTYQVALFLILSADDGVYVGMYQANVHQKATTDSLSSFETL